MPGEDGHRTAEPGGILRESWTDSGASGLLPVTPYLQVFDVQKAAEFHNGMLGFDMVAEYRGEVFV